MYDYSEHDTVDERPRGARHVTKVAAEHGEPEHGEPERKVPAAILAAEQTERERLARMDKTRLKAIAAGWPGPYRVQVPEQDDGDSDDWTDLRNTHDRRGTAMARARALVHGVPYDDAGRPCVGWYGDRLTALGTHRAARVVNAAGEVVHEEPGS